MPECSYDTPSLTRNVFVVPNETSLQTRPSSRVADDVEFEFDVVADPNSAREAVEVDLDRRRTRPVELVRVDEDLPRTAVDEFRDPRAARRRRARRRAVEADVAAAVALAAHVPAGSTFSARDDGAVDPYSDYDIELFTDLVSSGPRR